MSDPVKLSAYLEKDCISEAGAKKRTATSAG